MKSWQIKKYGGIIAVSLIIFCFYLADTKPDLLLSFALEQAGNSPKGQSAKRRQVIAKIRNWMS